MEQHPATFRCACCGSSEVMKAGVIPRRFRSLPIGGKAVWIPESFYRPILDKGQVPIQYSTREGEYLRTTPVGVYDTGILCALCDGKIGQYDDYAKQVLSDWPKERHPVRPLYRVQGYDYATLKLFFLTLLWRAGISTQRMFDRVKLGPHENRLLTMIKARDPGGAQDYSVIITTFDDPDTREMSLAAAQTKDKWGCNYYRFNTAGYAFSIKAERRPTKGPFEKLMLSPGRPL